MSTVPLEIITPERIVFTGDVDAIRAPGRAGSFAVLPGHIPMISTLSVGDARLYTSDGVRVMALSGGLAEVLRSGVTILAETAEFADEIDPTRAQSAVERARARLKERSPNLDTARADQALFRALNRLKVSRL